jgi:hypothetical protein
LRQAHLGHRLVDLLERHQAREAREAALPLGYVGGLANSVVEFG